MKKSVELLSVEAFTDFECFVAMIIDGYTIDRVRVVADIGEIQAILNSRHQRNIDMHIYFDTYKILPIKGPQMEAKSSAISGRVIRIVTDTEIEFDCGFVVEVHAPKDFWVNISLGDYLTIQGYFSGIQY